ncbi:MAG: hypothetical protein OHK0053_35910 [Microscillaceae bacterium]
MKIVIQTRVGQSPEKVFAGFDQSLFLRLNPPFPPVRLLRFDGCKTGDIVQIKLNFLLFSQIWESHITDDGQPEGEIFFVDEGVRLPFFLKYWKHRHRIVGTEKGAIIIDDIEYRAPFGLLTYLLYPVLYAQFAYRRPIYRRVFSQKTK